MTGNYKTRLFMGPYYNGEVLAKYDALEKIVDAIEAINTKDEYDGFSIAWHEDTGYDGEWADGDVVVSIYNIDEEEGCGIDDDGDCVERKCWCSNDTIAHDAIYRALSRKRAELLGQ